jgi:hypothetical protein
VLASDWPRNCVTYASCNFGSCCSGLCRRGQWDGLNGLGGDLETGAWAFSGDQGTANTRSRGGCGPFLFPLLPGPTWQVRPVLAFIASLVRYGRRQSAQRGLQLPERWPLLWVCAPPTKHNRLQAGVLGNGLLRRRPGLLRRRPLEHEKLFAEAVAIECSGVDLGAKAVGDLRAEFPWAARICRERRVPVDTRPCREREAVDVDGVRVLARAACPSALRCLERWRMGSSEESGGSKSEQVKHCMDLQQCMRWLH